MFSLVIILNMILGLLMLTPAQVVNAQDPYVQPAINKQFSSISIVPGTVTQISVKIFNENSFGLINAAYTDTMPAAIRIADPANIVSDCDGPVTAVPGSNVFSLVNGVVPAKAGVNPGECTVTIDVTSTVAGNHINTIPVGGLTANDAPTGLIDLANEQSASATLQVNLVQPPSLSKTFNPSTVWAGQTSQLSINIRNNEPTGGVILTQVSVTDPLPTQVVVAASPSVSFTNCGTAPLLTAVPGTGTVTLSNVTINPQTTCIARVNVVSTVQNTYNNQIAIGAVSTLQGVTNAGIASAPLNVQAIGILKAYEPGTIPAGGTSTLRITLRNPTDSAYTNVNLTDTLPGTVVSLVDGSQTNGCGGSLTVTLPRTLTLTGGTIPASPSPPTLATCDITVQVITPPTAGTAGHTNTITPSEFSNAQVINLPGNVSATLNVQAGLTVLKSFSPTTIPAGGTSTVTVTLRNHTAAPFTGVNLTDTMPAGLTISGTPATLQCGGAITSTANSVTLTGGTIPAAPTPPGTPGTCTIVFQVTAASTGTYSNTIPANDVNTTQGVRNLTTTTTNPNLTVVATGGPVTLTKSFLSSIILAGATVRLRLDITAPVDTNLTNFVITDNLPVGMSMTSSPNATKTANCIGGTLSAPAGGSVISWIGGTINANQLCRIEVNVTSVTPGLNTNTIRPADITNDQTRTIAADRSASVTVTSLTTSKSFYPSVVNPLGVSRMTIILTNRNASRLVNVSLQDFLPGNTTNGLVVAPTPNIDSDCGSNITATPGTQTISLVNGIIPAQVGSIAGICRISIDIEGRGVPASYTNFVRRINVVGTIEGTSFNINPLADSSAPLTIGNLTITVVKKFIPILVYGGAASIMEIELRNPNAAILTGIYFDDVMPDGMVIADPPSFNPGGCGGSLTGVVGTSTIIFRNGTLNGNTSCTMTLRVTMTVNGNLTNIIPAGSVRTSNGVSNPLEARASLTNLAGASISKGFAPNPILAGGDNYSILTITIRNTSGLNITGMGLVDNLPGTLPAGLSVAGPPAPAASTTCVGGSVVAAPGDTSIIFSGASLTNDSSCTITIPVASTVPGDYQNTIPAGTLTSTQGTTNSQPATDTLTVLAPASLGDFVWRDDNLDGIQDGGEPGIANVTVTLYTGMGTSVGTTTTDSNGFYLFDDLLPGDYYVVFTPLAGYAISPQDQGADDALDSDANPSTGQTATTTLVAGENDLTWDAGMYQLASLGDFVWEDLDADGIQDAGESGIENVTVTLYTGGGAYVGETTTDASGGYGFSNLQPGSYYLVFSPPAGYLISPQNQGPDDAVDSDPNPATGQTATTTLSPGENDPTWDAGLYRPAALGDFVWEDLNGDGIQDAGEPGIGNVTVTLYNGAGVAQGSTTTNGSGYYGFTDLTPGDYYVVFTSPSGFTFSPQNQGGDDALDSDPNTATGQTITTTLVSGENDPTWDAGLYRLASLGDFVWRDDNLDGIQDIGEPGIPNVTVTLFTGAGVSVGSTTTNSSGYYGFSDLPPGEYYVVFTPPAGYTLSPQNQGADDALDSDADPVNGRTATTLLESGENDPTWDAGMYQLASLGDFVWDDLDADGIQDAGEPGIPNVTVTLYTSAGVVVATTTTNGSGLYGFSDLLPGDYYLVFTPPAGYLPSPQNQGADDTLDSDPDTTSGQTAVTTLDPGENDPSWDAGYYRLASLGDFVWEDLNADGIQDTGEPGIPNVTVTLYTGVGTVVGSTTTNGSGYYGFSDLPPGDYYLIFTPPAGYLPSPQNQGGNDGVDSDPDPANGRTETTTLESNESDLTWDAGYYRLASLGDFVWEDLDMDGIQDSGEPGIQNVTVTLFSSAGVQVATTVTDGTGYYQFPDLTPGDYYVEFTLPNGFFFSQRDQGADDSVDSDPNPTDGRTGTISLESNEDDPTWDAGLYRLGQGDFSKTIIATNQTFTSGNSVAIGELLTYRLAFRVPPGATLDSLTLTDILDRGLVFVGCDSITADSNINTSLVTGFSEACNPPANPVVETEPAASANPADAGRKVVFSLGEVTNTDDSAAGTITIVYQVGVLNSLENQDGVDLNNTATMVWDKGTIAASAPDVTIIEPDFSLRKTANTTVADPGDVITFTLTLRHTSDSNTDAFEVVLQDTLPSELEYVPGSMTVVSGPAGGVVDEGSLPLLQVTWADFRLLTGGNRTSAVVRFRAILRAPAGDTTTNRANLAWTSLPGVINEPQSEFNPLSTERFYDPPSDINIYGTNASVMITSTGLPSLLPATGFAPGVITRLLSQPTDKQYQDLGNFWVEIPRLNVQIPIVGIPVMEDQWDLSWLWTQAGWLNGTAYPTHAGNSALTAHVYLPNGRAGPFNRLGELRYGDQVIVHMAGLRYVYEVRTNQVIGPYDSKILRHEDLPWLTLLTCKGFSQNSGTYDFRIAIRAVQVSVESEPAD